MTKFIICKDLEKVRDDFDSNFQKVYEATSRPLCDPVEFTSLADAERTLFLEQSINCKNMFKLQSRLARIKANLRIDVLLDNSQKELKETERELIKQEARCKDLKEAIILKYEDDENFKHMKQEFLRKIQDEIIEALPRELAGFFRSALKSFL